MLTAKQIMKAAKFRENYPREEDCGPCFGAIDSLLPCFETSSRVCLNRIFLSFRFTGEDYEELDRFFTEVCAALRIKRNAIFCSLWLDEVFQQGEMSPDHIYDYCLKRIAENDILLAIIRREEESKGMLLELDEALSLNKKIILFIQKGLGHQIFRDKSDEVYEYNDMDDLIKQLQIV